MAKVLLIDDDIDFLALGWVRRPRSDAKPAQARRDSGWDDRHGQGQKRPDHTQGIRRRPDDRIGERRLHRAQVRRIQRRKYVHQGDWTRPDHGWQVRVQIIQYRRDQRPIHLADCGGGHCPPGIRQRQGRVRNLEVECNRQLATLLPAASHSSQNGVFVLARCTA